MGKYQVEVYNCYSLAVRTGASVSNKAVAWLQRGNKRTSSKQHSNGWMYIDEEKGWANGKYLKKIKDLTPKPKPQPVKKPTAKPSPPKKNPPAPAQKIDKHAVDAFASGGSSSVSFTSQSTSRFSSQSSGSREVLNAHTPEGVGIGGHMEYDEFKSVLESIRKNSNVVTPYDESISKTLFENFNRFKIEFPDHVLSKTFSYVFFTRPELNILTEDGVKLRGSTEHDPFFYQVYQTHPQAVRSLTRHFSKEHRFHPFLSNATKSFEVADETLKNIEHGETLVGHKINYGKSNIEAHTAGTFSIQYEEDNDFNIYTLHKLWVEYISRAYRGAIPVKREHIYRKILDYACSVYYFVCGPDGETVLFWSKYFGVFPTNVPTSSTSWTKGASPRPLELNITYAYSMKEDLMPATLYEFNMASSEGFTYEPIYNKNNYSVGRTISGSPFVEKVDIDGHAGFKLRFRKKS